MWAPRSIELNKDIGVRLVDNLLIVLTNDGLDWLGVLIWNSLGLQVSLDFSV